MNKIPKLFFLTFIDYIDTQKSSTDLVELKMANIERKLILVGYC